MFHIILGIHLVLCVSLVILVLLQQGKGANMGAAFGGNSQTVFGAAGAATMLTKVTTGMAVAFMVTSILLVRHYSDAVEALGTQAADPLDNAVMGKVVQAAPVASAPEQAVAPQGAAPQGAAPQGAAPQAVAPQAAPEDKPSAPSPDKAAK